MFRNVGEDLQEGIVRSRVNSHSAAITTISKTAAELKGWKEKGGSLKGFSKSVNYVFSLTVRQVPRGPKGT